MKAVKVILIVVVAGMLAGGCSQETQGRSSVGMPAAVYPPLVRPLPGKPSSPEIPSSGVTFENTIKSVPKTASEDTAEIIPILPDENSPGVTPEREMIPEREIITEKTRREGIRRVTGTVPKKTRRGGIRRVIREPSERAPVVAERDRRDLPYYITVPPSREVYVSGYFREEVKWAVIRELRNLGYRVAVKSRAAPLRLRIKMNKRGHLNICTALLLDQDGRVVAQGQGESYYWHFRVSSRYGRLRVQQRRCKAEIKAAMEAVRCLARDHF